jgi:hypothetical protein
MRSRLLLVCLVLVCGSTAYGADSDAVQLVSSRLSIHDSLSGRFRQSKQLSFMEGSIVSSGSFALSTAHGLSWLVEEPLRSEMTVRQSQVMLDGKKIQDRGVGHLRAMIMQAFMDGDLLAVQDDFSVSGELLDQQWRLRLEPKSIKLRAVLSHVELRGNEFLEEISIVELNETRTLIEFSEVVGRGSKSPVQDAAST